MATDWLLGILTRSHAVSVPIFSSTKGIVSVTVPGTVKSIQCRAFADCVNLKKITLCEGVEEIDSNVFTGCCNLRSIRLPSSIKKITGWAFWDSGLKEAVFTAWGDTLVFCPACVAGTEYTVPPTVRQIGVQAFASLPNLQRVHLPQGLEIIRERAFIGCGMEEVHLPPTVQTVEDGAFYNCKNLRRITGPAQTTPLESALEFWRMRGSHLTAAYTAPPPPLEYLGERAFRKLAERCALGNAAAMGEMMDYFHQKARAYPDSVFFERAENFWMYRAHQYGNGKATAALAAWVDGHPGERLRTPFLSGRLHGYGKGICLNALGFFAFDEEREYSFYGVDADGVVKVNSYESEDGPDEDGFGRETYYDWWFMDDCLNFIPHVKCLHSYSSIDLQTRSAKQLFADTHDLAARSLKQRNSPFRRPGR